MLIINCFALTKKIKIKIVATGLDVITYTWCEINIYYCRSTGGWDGLALYTF